MKQLITLALVLAPATASAADVTVPVGGDIQAAIDQAMPGDTVTLEAGTHDIGELSTARDGAANSPITLAGADGAVLMLQGGDSRMLDVQHAYFRIENVTFDAGFAAARIMRIDDGATGFVMRGVEARNAAQHCIDIRNTSDVLIEDSLIHHCLVWNGGREDAHGISAGGVQNLTIRNTEIHSFTGDALQVDPGRNEPGWDDVVVDGCRFWLAPINDGAGGVPNGVVPGENAIDTKTADGAVGTLTIRNTVSYGFRNGEISNMAAYNLKEDVEVIADALTVYDSEIAFRIRGRAGFGAQPVLTNIVVYDVDTALRLEDELQATIPLHHVTFGRDIGQYVDEAGGADASILDAQNVVVFGAAPAAFSAVEAAGADFEDVANDNYIPAMGAAWVDTGDDLGIDHDRRGAMRPQGAGPDPGAYELGDAPASDMGFPPIDDMGNNTPGNNDPGNNDPGNNGPGNNTPGNNTPGNNGGPVDDMDIPQNNTPGGDIGSGSTGEDPGGCQCSATQSSDASWLLLLVGLLWRRRSE